MYNASSILIFDEIMVLVMPILVHVVETIPVWVVMALHISSVCMGLRNENGSYGRLATAQKI